MRSVILFSGGLDSYATLVLAKEQSEVVAAIHVRYGQPHGDAEITAVNQLIGNTPLVVLDVPTLGVQGDIFIGRNPILLALAASVAVGLDANTVWVGFCKADAAAFPDCRLDFLGMQETALRLALDDVSFSIEAPLMFHSKVETLKILTSRGLAGDAILVTHTCYRGNHHTKHDWGFGCGECNACLVRATIL